MTYDPNGIGFSDKDSVLSWLDANRNPDLWPHVVFQVNYDHPNALDYVEWIVSQPECDKATAVIAMGLTYCHEAIYREIDEHNTRIAQIICENSEAGFYTRNVVGGFEVADERTHPAHILGAIEEGCKKHLNKDEPTRLPIPLNILKSDYPNAMSQVDYMVDETGILHYDLLDPFFVKMLKGEV